MNPFDLNLRHLRALTEIVSRNSLTAAAQAVNLTQPALTQGLRKLEQQLGATLVDRRFDGATPTHAGLTMAARAEAALAHLAAAAKPGGRRGGRGFAWPDRLMTATQLHAALALADAGSFAAAAIATGLSQPALHRAVRDLEQLLGMPIAERAGRGVILTGDGRRLVRGIRLAALEIEAGMIELSADPHDAGSITVGAMPLCRALLLPHAITRFIVEAPKTAIDIREGSWRELVEPLHDGSVDLIVGALRPETPTGLEQHPLFEDHLAVIGRVGHPLARVNQPSLDQLANFSWIVGQPETPLRARWDLLFAGATLPEKPIECGSVMVIRGILQGSDFLTLLSPDQVALEIASGVLTMIGPPLLQGVRTIGFTTRARWRPTAAQRRFVELVRDAATVTRVPQKL